ncbi:DUF6519 domain-containing protein [Streptomyces sp. HNM0574]|uniref:DUF6519 domain-containing protein n=1 Tax=Streptomyces sp. HNM0574 TaxID=2714954 RepID=UPI00146F0909|nr:DUF6519 domain-containing protein [Streptomyces sp. HNM0574]NLU68218.1 hypothetical protein [Streptomyces sp. HNM0574]
MHADLSRSTFRPQRRYSGVLAQQGRVQLDADANEQAAIQLHHTRTTTADLIGQHGGPSGAAGFRIQFLGSSGELDDLAIGPGRYYVDGILCEADRPAPGVPVPEEGAGEEPEDKDGPPEHWTYWDQPDAHLDPERPGDRLPSGFPYLAYLKVWERAVTAAEDPAIRETALGAAATDTAARRKVVWQVRTLAGDELGLDDDRPGKDAVREAFTKWTREQAASDAKLAARSERPDGADDDPCLVRPDARYRGPENQLYRVEIHRGGDAKTASFKWSRENGSVTFPVEEVDGTWAVLGSVGGDGKLDLDVGDLVEFTDTATAERLDATRLLRVEEVDLPGRQVRLSAEPEAYRPGRNPVLRRWDHRDPGHGLRQGALPVEEGRWLPLEDGVEVYFAQAERYRTGDYWLIPARTATGTVEWPADTARRPLLQDPYGIAVHWAPLAWVQGEKAEADLRYSFTPLASAVPVASEQELALEEEAAEQERYDQRRAQADAAAQAPQQPPAGGSDEPR